jgi:hypothetical protein
VKSRRADGGAVLVMRIPGDASLAFDYAWVRLSFSLLMRQKKARSA